VSAATVDLFEQVDPGHGNGARRAVYLRRTKGRSTQTRRHQSQIRLTSREPIWSLRNRVPRKKQVESYEKLTRMLFTDGFVPAIATHDVALLRLAKNLARERGLKPGDWEAQMLLGVRRDIQEQLVREGCRVRVYVTFGTQWVPYFMRRLAERPANVAFVLRSLVQGK
jgi:proline dehydrogenase